MNAGTNDKDFVHVARVRCAARSGLEMLHRAEHMKQWWGPKGFTVIAAKMDLRPGGSYHYGMQSPDGNTMWGKFVYREIVPQERIVFINSFSDEKGGITRHPHGADLAAGDAVDLHLRGSGQRQDAFHHPLVAAQCERG